MIKKRFVLNNGEESEYFTDLDDKYDNGDSKTYWFNEHEDFCDVVDLLNALHEENQALKKKIDIMADVFLQSNDLIEIEQVFYTKVCEPSEHFDEETLSMITNSLLGSDVE